MSRSATIVVRRILFSLIVMGWPVAATAAIIVDPFYAPFYQATSLGAAPGVPFPYGGITFMPGDTENVLVGGFADNVFAAIYREPLARDGAGHITGYAGPASFVANARTTHGGIDGGLDVGPGNPVVAARRLFLSELPGAEGDDRSRHRRPGLHNI
jgi:hypothetical protein